MMDHHTAPSVLQEKFSQNFLARECRNNRDSDESEAQQIDGVRAVLLRHYALLVPTFMFYSCSVSALPFFMGLNEFTAFLDECHIPDNESQGVKRSDLDTTFIVCTRKVPRAGFLVVGSVFAYPAGNRAPAFHHVENAVCACAFGKAFNRLQGLHVHARTLCARPLAKS
jgi:hypothetical protein